MLIYFVLYFVINSCANTLSVQSVSAEYVMYLCSFSYFTPLFCSSFYFKKGSSVASSSALSTTPLVRHNTSPFRKSISVGTDWMRYWLAVTPYLSTSTLMIRMRSPNTLFTCSRMGCIVLQGWHHVAKKSTRTSWPLFITLLNVSIIICLSP